MCVLFALEIDLHLICCSSLVFALNPTSSLDLIDWGTLSSLFLSSNCVQEFCFLGGLGKWVKDYIWGEGAKFGQLKWVGRLGFSNCGWLRLGHLTLSFIENLKSLSLCKWKSKIVHILELFVKWLCLHPVFEPPFPSQLYLLTI